MRTPALEDSMSSEQTSLCYGVQFFPGRREGFESDSNLVHCKSCPEVAQVAQIHDHQQRLKEISRKVYKLLSRYIFALFISFRHSVLQRMMKEREVSREFFIWGKKK